MSINARLATQKIAGLATGYGAGQIVRSIVTNNVVTTNLFQQVTVGSGGMILSMMVGDQVSNYTQEKVVEFFDWYDGLNTKSS